MTNQNIIDEPFVFGLDIGTRSVVGIVGYKQENKFYIIGHHIVEHNTRAMIDGQIQDIEKVTQAVKEVKSKLEEQINQPLKNVYIAAAGRVLKTSNIKVELTLPNETQVNNEHIYSLELKGVEEAHLKVIESNEHNVKYHCVGYSVVKYYLNEYVMTNIVGHKAKKIGAEVLATFLPQEVIDSLYSVTEKADLKVVGLTLEPIAAINVAIPEQYRLLNITLVDIGAGTSDIAITKDGSIIAYGMIPYAGDEITEYIVHKYLVDFATAEKIKLKLANNKIISFKDIMGISHKYEPKQILNQIFPAIESLAERISKKILELNGNKPTNAVFCVGGGGQIDDFTKILSSKLNVPNERVALRGSDVLKFVTMKRKGMKKEPSIVTPVGIALSAYYHNSNFIKVIVNGKSIKLYNNNHLTIIDVAALVGFDYKNLFPKRGQSINFTVNGIEKEAKGKLGEAAKIMINDKEVGINHPIKHKDKIDLIEATSGDSIQLQINQLNEFVPTIKFMVNGKKIVLPRMIKANDKIVSEDYEIKPNDDIYIYDYYPLKDLIINMDIDDNNLRFNVNGKIVDKDHLIYEMDEISW
ncbi:MAG: cell division protein FtsA [bacterium]